MILYLSLGISPEVFKDFFVKGYVGSSLQAQRFNSLVIEGIGNNTNIAAVGHPEYKRKIGTVPNMVKTDGNVTFYILGNNCGFFRKVSNFYDLYMTCTEIIKKNNVEVILCDAISPIYSLTARLLSKKFHIPSIAIVTDIPIIMDANHISIMTKVSQSLMQKHDGYVLLTEAMNRLVNPDNKKFIVMEGLCDYSPIDYVIEPLNNNKTIFLFTGSLAVQTGIYNLIEAFKLMKRNDVELWIYGGGSAEDYVREQADFHPNIKFGGLVSNEEAAKLQRQADILINPRPTNLGYAEYSFPSKIMEYMVSGTPVLSTKLPGIPKEYYNYIYTIQDDTVNGIFESMERVIEINPSLRKEKGKRSRDFVLADKNKKKQGERIVLLANQIAKNL